MLKPPPSLQSLLAAVALLSCVGSHEAWAHEFWIEPVEFEIQTGDILQANLHVGQQMQGNTLLYIPDHFTRFSLTVGNGTRPVQSRTGDIPAVSEMASEDGLYLLSYVSTDSLLTYSDRQKFERFLRDEGIEWVAAAHERRQLPATGFTEAYQRFAKALVKVGSGTGEDRALGLEFELIVETNPYTARADEITVQLLWQGNPFPDARINLFRRHFDQVSQSHLVTDAQGRIRIPLDRAPGIYLLNAVHMIEPPANEQDIVWKSLWASTTFEIRR